MTIGINSTLRDARLTLILDAIDDDGTAGKLTIYSGTRPATGAEPDEYDNLALVVFDLDYPCGTITNGVLAFSPISDDEYDFSEAINTGIAEWGRITTTSDIFVMDLSVTDLFGSGDIKIDSTEIYEGNNVFCYNASINEGNP
jgi:hypothetical protein